MKPANLRKETTLPASSANAEDMVLALSDFRRRRNESMNNLLLIFFVEDLSSNEIPCLLPLSEGEALRPRLKTTRYEPPQAKPRTDRNALSVIYL